MSHIRDTFIVLDLPQKTPICGWEAKPPSMSKTTLDYPPISCGKARLKTVESWVSHGTLCIMKDVGVVYSEGLRYYYLCLIKEELTMSLSVGGGGGRGQSRGLVIRSQDINQPTQTLTRDNNNICP